MRLLASTILILSLSGCSLFQLGGSKKPSIPAKPEHQQPEFQTAEQQSVDIIDQIADVAVFEGLSANSMGSVTLKEHSENLVMLMGKPVETVDWKDQEASKKVIKVLKELETEKRILDAEYEEALDELRNKDTALRNVTRKNNSLMGWLWFIGIALALLCFLCPTVGVPLVMWLIKRGKKLAEKAVVETSTMVGQQFDQISEAFEDLQKEDPEAYKKVKEKVNIKADSSTREALNKRAKLV